MCGGRAPGEDAADGAAETRKLRADDSDIVGGGEDRKHTARV